MQTDRIRFPILYRKNTNGSLSYWNIVVIPQDDGAGLILTEHGQLGTDSPQTAQDVVTEGKNLGKANATTAFEQAVAEAKSKWELQKKKKGYVESKEAAMAGEVDALVEGGIFPMLAQKFEKRADKVTYPAFVQPKFDGHRCIGIVKDGAATLWSRTRKRINTMPHIEKALVLLSKGQDAIFDGELYNHDYKHDFEKITSLIRPKAPVEGHEKVKLYIYDMPSVENNFEVRNFVIKSLFEAASVEAKAHLVEVDTFRVEDESEVPIAFEKFLGNGYEGAMLRTIEGMYLSHPTNRSPHLLKLKKFDDAEFEIVAVNEGRGKFAGLAIFQCRAGNGELFEAPMNAPLNTLREMFQNADKLVGEIITVQFQGFTKAKQVPRFPRALRFREDL